jgi:hypothetical protein
MAFSFQVLLKLYNLMGKLFDFLLVDMREVIDMRVVELFN